MNEYKERRTFILCEQSIRGLTWCLKLNVSPMLQLEFEKSRMLAGSKIQPILYKQIFFASAKVLIKYWIPICLFFCCVKTSNLHINFSGGVPQYSHIFSLKKAWKYLREKKMAKDFPILFYSVLSVFPHADHFWLTIRFLNTAEPILCLKKQ